MGERALRKSNEREKKRGWKTFTLQKVLSLRRSKTIEGDRLSRSLPGASRRKGRKKDRVDQEAETSSSQKNRYNWGKVGI